MQRPANPHYVA